MDTEIQKWLDKKTPEEQASFDKRMTEAVARHDKQRNHNHTTYAIYNYGFDHPNKFEIFVECFDCEKDFWYTWDEWLEVRYTLNINNKEEYPELWDVQRPIMKSEKK